LTNITPKPSPDTHPTTVNNLPKVWEGSIGVVQQGRHWSSALIWITSSLFILSTAWAFIARLDQTISVRGRLEPSGTTKSVDSPSAGVINKVFIQEGNFVTRGQPLFQVEARSLISRRDSIERNLQLLALQAKTLTAVVNSKGNSLSSIRPPDISIISSDDYLQQQATARNQVQQLISRLEQVDRRLQSRQQTYRLKLKITDDLRILYSSGAMSRNNYLGEVNQLQELNAEIAGLREERARILGEANSQLNQINQQTNGLRSELYALKESINYRTVLAPSSGVLFDTKIGPSSVVTVGQVLAKIVPSGRLQARIDISNTDIGFVRLGLPVSVSVDSFPSGEFGYLSGTLTSIGSDALEPKQPGQQYYFPGVVTLREQQVLVGKARLNLQSGMSVTANIKLRARPAITLFTDMFTKQLEGVKRFR